MFRKFSFWGALCTLLVIFAPLTAAQDVSIQLTPITYPIVLPDSGGVFDYLLTVTNQAVTPVTATVWCLVTLPDGSSWGPVLGPGTQTLGAGQTLSYYRTQTVPPRAPYGYYTLHAYAGMYPDTVYAQDQFEFQRQALGGTEQIWVARCNGPGNSYDIAYSLAIDYLGNVYVTGRSYGGETLNDYATIKYNWVGVEQWVVRYNGHGDGDDRAYSIAVDTSGNVYVTGKSYGSSGTSYDYATIKYNSAGAEQWVARYSELDYGWAEARSLAVDRSGNVYVTGFSSGGATYSDYATIKYNWAGLELWVARYNGPGNSNDCAHSIAVDISGNVYVTGAGVGMGTSWDYTTIKYNSEGEEQWVACYNGPENSGDTAHSIAVDGSGNVYITGYSISESTGADYATIKYDSEGAEQWVARYNGPGNEDDYAYSLDIDSVGNVYVSGQSYGSGTSYDYATIKYDSEGGELWVARYNGQGNDDDVANSIAVDSEGNVYVAGGSSGIGTYGDYTSIKYSSEGAELWVARYNGPGNDTDYAHSLAVDGAGNVYVTGGSCGPGTYSDYATIKYSGGNLDNWQPAEATLFGQPLPRACSLEQNYPNPFNAATVFWYNLKSATRVKLSVYDVSGRLISTLVNGWRQAGSHELTFDASHLPSGMYFYRLEAGDYTASGKMVLMK